MKYRALFRRASRLSLPVTLALAATAQARRRPTTAVHSADTNASSTGESGATGRVAPTQKEYVIGPEDVLAIDVWREPEISRVEPVRPDGKITLPLVGEIQASGQTTNSLQAEITARLTNYIHQPSVTVIVQQADSHRFNIIGDVLRPGSYALGERTSVLDAIAVAGGFGEFATVTHIFVVRQLANGSSLRIPFNYKAAVRGNRRDLDLYLKPGDTIIVP